MLTMLLIKTLNIKNKKTKSTSTIIHGLHNLIRQFHFTVKCEYLINIMIKIIHFYNESFD